MTDKKNLILKLLILGFATTFCVIIVMVSVFNFKPNNKIKVEVYKVDNGFGYLLNENGKVLIKQNFIPAVPGKKAFCTIEDAKKTANIVKQKIVDKKSPTITINELKQLNLNYNCLDLSTR